MTRVLAAILILATLTSLVARPAAAQAPTSPAGHWAYVPPRRPSLPEPRPRNDAHHPLDLFLFAAQERRDLVPLPAANLATLARRASLALTQLPPAPDQLSELLAPHDSAAADAAPPPDAYLRFLDRLLASPHYGERMAQPWLDLAHYADTHGYHADAHRDMWRWRDWVIDALNRDLPYDQFLTDQLAGDLLAGNQPAGDSQADERRIATGLFRNHMIIFENGVIEEEYRVEYVMDRVTTLGVVALGQTLQCARCHDHKHDPFTREDFYRLFAYFNNVPEKGVDGDHGNAVPLVVAPTRLQSEQLAALQQRLAAAQSEIAARLAQPQSGEAAWERRVRPAGAAPPRDAWLHLTFDEPRDEPVLNAAQPTAASPPRVAPSISRIPGRSGSALLFDGQTSLDVAPSVHESSDRGWSLVASLFPTLDERLTIAARLREIPALRGWALSLEERRPTLRIIGLPAASDEGEGDPLTGRIVSQADVVLPLRKWQQVAVVVAPSIAAPAGAAPAADVPTIRWFVDGRPVAARRHESPPVAQIREALEVRAVVRWGRLADQFGFRGALDEGWLFDRPLEAAEVQALVGLDPLEQWLAIAPAERTAEQTRAIRERFLFDTSLDFRQWWQRLRDDQAAYDQLRRALPTTMVMAEMSPPRATHILERGRYDAPEALVGPDVPRWLVPGDREARPHRLALAQWLFHDDHPLTARVAVNRLWQTVFGRGLVATPDDFGLHGDPPTHPELLDWLAVELCGTAADGRSRWDLKRLHRDLVFSAAFRRSADAPLRLRELDPDNAWLTRGPAQRLAAEAIRDQALAVSGLLDRRVGGPSVFPYQPPGLWEELAYDAQQFTAQTYRESRGGDLYRRSLYTFWKRAAPPPSLAIFDAPDRETCAARRPVSNTPQQALVLMNDRTYLEAARALAAQFVPATPNLSEAHHALDRLFQHALARPPTAAERAALRRAYDDEFTRRKGGDAAAALHDAIEFVAQIVLSLDETVTQP
ncbi:MAG: DUF1549 and DUF1553 domain-containing protein [Pirellulales bacterium]